MRQTRRTRAAGSSKRALFKGEHEVQLKERAGGKSGSKSRGGEEGVRVSCGILKWEIERRRLVKADT